MPQLPATVTVKDPALHVLALLRILHALNRYWSSLYEVNREKNFLQCKGKKMDSEPNFNKYEHIYYALLQSMALILHNWYPLIYG